MRGQPGFFNVDDQLKRLSDLGDQFEECQATVDFKTCHPQLNSSRVCQVFGFRSMMVSLPRGSEITKTQAMPIVCCIAVSAETRTSVAELAPTIADAAERCCAGRIAGLLAEGGGGRSDALIHGTCPLGAGLHSADRHDGRDDGVDFLGRTLLIRLFIAGRILADADV
jgi:hypothetical protein